MLAELFGRSDGYSGGKGGSTHLAVNHLGVLGTNGIVGASIGIATGAALAAQLEGHAAVAVAFFGDGAINQGTFLESMNLAAVWRLPAIYVCENNKFAQSAAIHRMVAEPDLALRGDALGVPSAAVDGMDVVAVRAAAEIAVGRARAGDGPTLIVADTWRFMGHMVGDSEIYRAAAEHEPWRSRDPVTTLESRLVTEGIASEAEVARVRQRIIEEIDDAERRATESPFPTHGLAFTDVYGGLG